MVLIKFKNFFLMLITEHYVGKYVEPMIWHYNSRETFSLTQGGE